MGRLTKQRLALHDHSVGAVAALSGLFLDKGRLHRIWLFWSPQSFDGRDGTSLGLSNRNAAGAGHLAVDQDRARSALSQAAAEFRSMQSDRISKHVQQRLRRIPRINCKGAAVHTEFAIRHRYPPGSKD